ncbi:MAG: alpha/beta fold hydrolase [Bacteroidia bacterium]|nr:alpha/beta fold hydrolase [Bacteroidia bacterium]
MKNILVGLTLVLGALEAGAQDFPQQDTTVRFEHHELHFSILKGEGTPILFESGAGNDGSVWHSLLQDINRLTGATLITYDRAGFGKSSLDTVHKEVEYHNLESSFQDLEKSLAYLGYSDEIVLVSHSYGGYLNYLYANKYPNRVKGIVALDIVHDYHTEGFADSLLNRIPEVIEKWRLHNPGMYYIHASLTQAADLISTVSIPDSIPVVDLVAELPFSSVEQEAKRWKSKHADFVKNHPRATGILAANCGHYIWRDNKPLVVMSIANLYASISSNEKRQEIEHRIAGYAITSSNEAKGDQYSERQNNIYGYNLLRRGMQQQALLVFELNTLLYPTSYNAFDSYGEALAIAGQTEKAIAMYEKSVQLNPENQNGRHMLKRLRGKHEN